MTPQMRDGMDREVEYYRQNFERLNIRQDDHFRDVIFILVRIVAGIMALGFGIQVMMAHALGWRLMAFIFGIVSILIAGADLQ